MSDPKFAQAVLFFAPVLGILFLALSDAMLQRRGAADNGAGRVRTFAIGLLATLAFAVLVFLRAPFGVKRIAGLSLAVIAGYAALALIYHVASRRLGRASPATRATWAVVAATPVAFLLPSRFPHLNAGKLALIGMIFTTFFLFTAGYNFPGGASHYTDWAYAIVRGETLPPMIAQRELGLPLLYLLSGFTFSGSFIGITLIYAAFAVLIAVLVYRSVEWASPAIAYWTGVICILSLAPFTYIKFFYPDQLYMFVNLLAIMLLVGFLWSGRFRYLYLFTLAAAAASFTRTAGNLMFPVLLVIGFIVVRKGFRHYLACALIFAAVAGAYQWHRYEIFDMRNQASEPVGKGMQILYSTYLYLGDFGYRLSPDIGPNTKRLFDRMREELQPTVRDSALIKKRVGDSPAWFMEKYFYPLTPEQLIEKIATEPNEEYYWNVVWAIGADDDRFLLEVAKEIVRAYPGYVVRYAMRNLWHALFAPGYATTRYNALGFIKTGGEFVPGMPGWGVLSEDPVTQYGSRAEREMEYFQLKTQPAAVQKLFATVQTLFLENYDTYVWISALPILMAWIGALLGLLSWAMPRTKLAKAMAETGAQKIVAPVIAVSALLVYEDLATALFSQPVYRYFHMTEPWRLVIAGFGLAFATRMLPYLWPAKTAPVVAVSGDPRSASLVGAIQRHDVLEKYFGTRRTQWIVGLLVLNIALFAWWVSSLLAHTRGAPPMEIVSATYGPSCSGIREGNVTGQVREACIYYRCPILVGGANWADPAPGCAKDFSVSYRCKGDEWPRRAGLAAPATGKTVEIECYSPPLPAIRIVSATYGQSCSGFVPTTGASNWVREGNVTQRANEACSTTMKGDRCSVRVDARLWGDPAQGCGKDFSIDYQCKDQPHTKTARVPAEAAWKSVELDCAAPRQ